VEHPTTHRFSAVSKFLKLTRSPRDPIQKFVSKFDNLWGELTEDKEEIEAQLLLAKLDSYTQHHILQYPVPPTEQSELITAAHCINKTHKANKQQDN
jgi:hypothetical protein